MVGNSIKSDIVPALNAGATAIHVPARYEWDMEKATEPSSNPRFFKALGFENVQELLTKI
jgi:putative hydrolase of the HAD superfamily